MEIHGYPNYLIYKDGKVEKIKGNKKGIIKSKNDGGYLRIRLTNEDGRGTFRIHRLIAQHYIPNPLNLPLVDHIDRDKTNNNICNLRWVTHSENSQNEIVRINSKSGIKNISQTLDKYKYKYWVYQKTIKGNIFYFKNKNKNIVLWCKFVYELKAQH